METGNMSNTSACFRKLPPYSETYAGQCKTTTATVLVAALTDALTAIATALRLSLISMEKPQQQEPVTIISPAACNNEIDNIIDKSSNNDNYNGDNVPKTATASSKTIKQRPVVSKQPLQRMPTDASSTSPTTPFSNNSNNNNNTTKRKKKSTGAEPQQRGKRAKATVQDPRLKTRQKSTTAAQTCTATNTSTVEIVEDVDELQNLVAGLIASSEDFQGQQNFYPVDPDFAYQPSANYVGNKADGFHVKP